MAFYNKIPSNFLASASVMDTRLRARLSRSEWFALALNLAALVLFIWVDERLGVRPFDYTIYLKTTEEDFLQYYYANWIMPLFHLWGILPFWWGYFLWGMLNLLGIFFASRVFGGSTALVLLTFQMFSAAFTGQITGLLVGGLALGWWGMAHRRWNIAGLGFWLACTKFQIGLPFGLLLWLTADADRRGRLRVLILPAVLASLSLVFFPGWPFDLIDRIRAFPPYDWASISLWHWVGPAALLFWLPPLLLRLGKHKRFLALAAATPLALPYFQQADLLVLFVLPVGWLPIALGNIGYLFFVYQFQVLELLWIAPLSLYLFIILPAAFTAGKNLIPPRRRLSQ